MYPEYNVKMKWEIQKTATHAETTLNLQHGNGFTDPNRRLQASVITNYQVAGSRAKVDGVVSISYPAKVSSKNIQKIKKIRKLYC